MERFKTKYLIAKEREAVFKAIAKLQAATNRAYSALKATQVTCEYCGQTHYPHDTPEFAAYAEATRAEDRAIFSAVLDKTIPVNMAAARFGKTPEQLTGGAEWIKYVRDREELERQEAVRRGDQPPATDLPGTTGADRGVESGGQARSA